MQKSENVLKKDGSTARPKITTLEKAIRELEKIVAECKFGKCFEAHIIGNVGSLLLMLKSFKYYYSKATNYGKPGG